MLLQLGHWYTKKLVYLGSLGMSGVEIAMGC